MTGQEQEAQAQDAGEQRKERAAAGCLTAIGVTFAGTLAITVPETAYYTAGLLTAASVRRARTWVARRRHDDEEQAEPVDIVAVLQDLGKGGEHVRLTQLQEAAGLPDTKTVRALLDEAGIPIRPGVRAGGKNGPGVHADDIPPLEATPSDGCLCRSDANANTNNDGGEEPQKGFRVEHTGQAGTTVYDLSETHSRHHATTGARRG
jgi:hypothetical protein